MSQRIFDHFGHSVMPMSPRPSPENPSSNVHAISSLTSAPTSTSASTSVPTLKPVSQVQRIRRAFEVVEEYGDVDIATLPLNPGVARIPEIALLAAPPTAADQLVAALVAAGVDTFFGIPGGPVMPLFDAVLRSSSANLVESRHETNAAFAAAGYHRATGRVPAVIVTAGPGATNAITGIVSAHLERVPMLVICGDVAWATTGGRLLQSGGREGIGIEGMLAQVTRATVRVALARSAASQTLAALTAATDPRNPGPALVVLPIDCGAKAADPVFHEHARIEIVSRIGDGVLVDTARRLAAAKRPMIIVGAACRRYADEVRRLIDTLGVPFTTTPQAKGIISEEHPLSLRHCGLAASWWARRYTKPGVDVALALGTDLDDVSVGPTPPISPTGFLIHVDTDPNVFSRNYRTSAGVSCDLRAFSVRLADVAAGMGLRNTHAAGAMLEAKAGSPFDCETFRRDDAEKISPHRVIHDLEQAAGPRTTFITDIGEHMLFGLHYLTARGPDDFVIHLGLGSMASGICSAIGYAIGNPRRRVVCICGDGGMQMAGAEILVAAKLGLPIVYAIFNDARYNMVYHGYKQQFERESAFSTPWVDFVGWAASMGLPGKRIDKPGQITAELLDSLTGHGRPVVLDIRHDADVRIRGAGRIEALQQMSTLPPAPR